jgi:ferritin-like metal-binding protein YciE
LTNDPEVRLGCLLCVAADSEDASQNGKAAANPEPKETFTRHRQEAQNHLGRLQKVFDVLGRRARGITCEAINGPIEEGEEVVEEFLAGSVRDAGLAACAQAIEHYEMVRLRHSDRLGKDRQPEGDRDAA